RDLSLRPRQARAAPDAGPLASSRRNAHARQERAACRAAEVGSRADCSARLPEAGVRRSQAVRAGHEELDRFFMLTRDLLCITGFDGNVKRVNPAWESALGYTTEELIGRP